VIDSIECGKGVEWVNSELPAEAGSPAGADGAVS
jgi:hypothetical protein